jgi:integrase/recombinase XerD
LVSWPTNTPSRLNLSSDRRYLHNVSPATISWYTHAFKWLPSESPAQDELKDAVLRMREKGLKETGCNAAIRAINAYLHRNSGAERKCGAGCNHPQISQLKEPQIILPTLTEAQVKLAVNWKPKTKSFYERRLHLLALLLLDTGCRITEALTLRVSDVDM